jgi:hypothetical protein
MCALFVLKYNQEFELVENPIAQNIIAFINEKGL